MHYPCLIWYQLGIALLLYRKLNRHGYLIRRFDMLRPYLYRGAAL